MGADFKEGQARVKQMETNSYHSGRSTPAGPMRVAGNRAKASNPTKGGGINRAKNKSSLQ